MWDELACNYYLQKEWRYRFYNNSKYYLMLPEVL